jgi:cellobiose phosphorylase
VKASFEGLRVEPSLPKAWNALRYNRKFRNATYDIEITRGIVPSILVDGRAIKGFLLPDFQDQKVHHVIVTIK